jgi:hypothetical protein
MGEVFLPAPPRNGPGGQIVFVSQVFLNLLTQVRRTIQFDLEAIYRDLKKREEQSPEKFVGIPISWGQKTGDQSRSAAAARGTAY